MAFHENQHYAEYNYPVSRFKKSGEEGFKFEKKAFHKIYTPQNVGQFKIKQPQAYQSIEKIFNLANKSTTSPTSTPSTSPTNTNSGGNYTPPEAAEHSDAMKEYPSEPTP